MFSEILILITVSKITYKSVFYGENIFFLLYLSSFVLQNTVVTRNNWLFLASVVSTIIAYDQKFHFD